MPDTLGSTIALLDSGSAMDIPIPYTIAEIEKAKADTMHANNMSDGYIRVLSWRGSGLDMGVASARNPIHMAVATIWAARSFEQSEIRWSASMRMGCARSAHAD